MTEKTEDTPAQGTAERVPECDAPANRAFEFQLGDEAATDAGFAGATRVVRLDVIKDDTLDVGPAQGADRGSAKESCDRHGLAHTYEVM